MTTRGVVIALKIILGSLNACDEFDKIVFSQRNFYWAYRM